MSRLPRDNPTSPGAHAAPSTDPSLRAWEVIVATVLRELDRREPTGPSTWMAAEAARLRTLLELSRSPLSTAADRTTVLQQLAGLEPPSCASQAEWATFLDQCESIIERCGQAARRDRSPVKTWRRPFAA